MQLAVQLGVVQLGFIFPHELPVPPIHHHQPSQTSAKPFLEALDLCRSPELHCTCKPLSTPYKVTTRENGASWIFLWEQQG